MTPTGTEQRVCQDIAERQQKGIAKYGVTVESNPLTLRQWLQHAYEETLDKAVYLKRAIEEMDKQQIYVIEGKECGVWDTIGEASSTKEALLLASAACANLPEDRIRISTPDNDLL